MNCEEAENQVVIGCCDSATKTVYALYNVLKEENVFDCEKSNESKSDQVELQYEQENDSVKEEIVINNEKNKRQDAATESANFTEKAKNDINIEDDDSNINIDSHIKNNSNNTDVEYLRWSPRTPESCEKKVNFKICEDNLNNKVDEQLHEPVQVSLFKEEQEQQFIECESKEITSKPSVTNVNITNIEHVTNDLGNTDNNNDNNDLNGKNKNAYISDANINHTVSVVSTDVSSIDDNTTKISSLPIYLEEEKKTSTEETASSKKCNTYDHHQKEEWANTEFTYLNVKRQRYNFYDLCEEVSIVVNLLELCSFHTIGHLMQLNKKCHFLFTCDEVWKEFLSIMHLRVLLLANNVTSHYYSFFVNDAITTRAIRGFYEYDSLSAEKISNYIANTNDCKFCKSNNGGCGGGGGGGDNNSADRMIDVSKWGSVTLNNKNNTSSSSSSSSNCCCCRRCPSEEIKSIQLRISTALLGHAWHEVGRVQILVKFFDGNAELLQGACGFSLCHRRFFFACSSFGSTACGPHFDVEVIDAIHFEPTNADERETLLMTLDETKNINIKMNEVNNGIDNVIINNNAKTTGYTVVTDLLTSTINNTITVSTCESSNSRVSTCSHKEYYLKFIPHWPEPSLADKSELSAASPLIVRKRMIVNQPTPTKSLPLQLCEEDTPSSITSRTANRPER